MEQTYQYKGTVDTFVPKIGIVKPGQTIITRIQIINPLFEISTGPTTQEIKQKLKFKTKK